MRDKTLLEVKPRSTFWKNMAAQALEGFCIPWSLAFSTLRCRVHTQCAKCHWEMFAGKTKCKTYTQGAALCVLLVSLINDKLLASSFKMSPLSYLKKMLLNHAHKILQMLKIAGTIPSCLRYKINLQSFYTFS